jgi:hypothetical protein
VKNLFLKTDYVNVIFVRYNTNDSQSQHVCNCLFTSNIYTKFDSIRVFAINFHTKLHMLNSNVSLITAIKFDFKELLMYSMNLVEGLPCISHHYIQLSLHHATLFMQNLPSKMKKLNRHSLSLKKNVFGSVAVREIITDLS